jgi:hypothetical protein
MKLEDFNTLGTTELLKYQEHIQNLIAQRQKDDCKVLFSADVEKITHYFNLNETHDLPEHVWQYFWKEFQAYDFDEKNWDFFLLISSLKQFEEKEDKVLDKSGFDDERWSLSEEVILQTLYQEEPGFLRKILSEPRFFDKLQAIIDNNRSMFSHQDYFTQCALDVLIEKNLLKIDDNWIKKFEYFTVDINDLKQQRVKHRGLFSVMEALIRHNQFQANQDEFKKLVVEGWQVMDIEALKKINNELLTSPVLYQEVPKLYYNKKSVTSFKEREKEQLMTSYAQLLNSDFSKVQWVLALPKNQDDNDSNDSNDWDFLKSHTESLINGLIKAYDQENRAIELSITQVTQNLDYVLKVWKEEAPDLYDAIVTYASVLNARRFKPNTVFEKEFNRVVLHQKLHTTLIENNENSAEDVRKMKI